MLKKIIPIALSGALLLTMAVAAFGAEEGDATKELNKTVDEIAAGVRHSEKQARDGINHLYDGFKKKQESSRKGSGDNSQDSERGRGRSEGEAQGR